MAKLGRRGDKLDLLIRQGATLGPFPVTISDSNGVAKDLTGTSVRATIRKDYGSVVAYPVTVALTEVLEGRFVMSIPAAQTAAIPYLGDLFDPDNQYVWDLEIEYANGFVEPIFWGIVQIAPEATT